MDIITLEDFKAHARITEADEDFTAGVIVDAANAYVTGLIVPDDDYEPPADVRQATLLVAAHWWERRETASIDQLSDIPLNAAAVLVNHRAWSFGR